MHKRKNITLAVALAGAITVTGVSTVSYINDIKGELTSANQQIKELKEVNSNQDKEIDRLVGELEVSIKENTELESTNKSLNKQVNSLEKEVEQLKEKVYPTQSVNRKSTGTGTPVNITMTFYGDFAHENGGYAGIDANGNKLVAGTVASNYYPQGTQFEYNGQIFTVRDRGGSGFNSANRLDVFVPRLKNESDSAYSKRLKEYGVRKVVMYKR